VVVVVVVVGWCGGVVVGCGCGGVRCHVVPCGVLSW